MRWIHNDVRVIFIEKPQVMFDQILDGCSPKITEQLCGQKRMFGKAWNVMRLEDFMIANSQTIWMFYHRRFGRSKKDHWSSKWVPSRPDHSSRLKIEDERNFCGNWDFDDRKRFLFGENPNLTRRSTHEGPTQHETRRAWQTKNFEENWWYFCRLRLFCIKVNVETTKRQVKFCRFCNLVLRW